MRSEFSFYGASIVATVLLAVIAYTHVNTPKAKVKSSSAAFLAQCDDKTIGTQYAERDDKRVMIIACARARQ